MVYIFELLGKKSNIAVLSYFLDRPTGEAYAGQLARSLELSKKSLLDGLATLLREGLIEARLIGRTKEYRLKRDDARVKQLKICRTVDALLPLVKKARESGIEAYLFGSAARGEDTEGSDVDLLLLGERPANTIIGELRKEEKIRPIFMTFLEYSQLAKKDRPFYERIEKDRIRLV
jgi:predicted nucleotidyltransferase